MSRPRMLPDGKTTITVRRPGVVARFRSGVAAKTKLEAAVARLQFCSRTGEAADMVEQLTELAKLGYTADDLRSLVNAAEQNHIIAFQYGRITHLGKATHESL